MIGETTSPVSRAWYGAPVKEFLSTNDETILGRLAQSGDFTLLTTQRNAWLTQISILRSSLLDISGTLFLEFNIPRMGRRVDAILVSGPAVIVIEFKVGDLIFDRGAIDQAWDYALDLKNFHKGSHQLPIVPVLVATDAPNPKSLELQSDPDGVYRPLRANAASLRSVIRHVLANVTGPQIDAREWSRTSYQPTPTIIEAARALYTMHSVEAIARFDAGATNLRVTSHRVEQLIEEARRAKRKAICFVTGVPGAGKTLVGLNIATHKRDAEEPTHAVFLSGNGPLVAVLQEALTRDEVRRRQAEGDKTRKGKIAESIKAFIQIVHHFRDDGLADSNAPDEHVVIFDEAQRAWNLRQTAHFMRRKKNHPGFKQSEPEFLISYMDRHREWAVIVCLVGGGQEINIGEAGIGEWIEALNKSFPHWHIYISPKLTDAEYAAGTALESIRNRQNVHLESDLHLAVSMRSFRSERVAGFVKALLDREKQSARTTLTQLTKFPIVLTRDLTRAKQWIRERARGTERFGMVASSKAQRLKPHAVDIRVNVNPVHWFLNEKEDTRSSYYLEDAATEFQVQGLELDWICVNWDADMRFMDAGWSFHDFRGDRWISIANADNRNYLRNAYRVLLTRARQGMVIFVPPGDPGDPTRAPTMYDPTFKYLADLGIPVLA